MFNRIKEYFRRETVLSVALMCAIVTVFLVPPDSAYLGYIDIRVLCLLMCLMAVVAGFQSCGAFRWLAYRILSRSSNGRVLSLLLVLLPFFSSMLITNDVALLTFVPFTIMLLEHMRCTSAAIPMLGLQTIAANLGSMATPVGNPQNLFLYSAYSLKMGEFFAVMLPLTAVSFVCLAAASIPVLPKTLPEMKLKEETLQHPKKLILYGILFVLCILTVFRVLHYGVLAVLVIGAIAVAEPKLLRELDFALLFTFVCFFIVSGNLSRLGAVRAFLQVLLDKSVLLTAVGTSQMISNVPAAVLLSEFTDNWRALLEGVNIGGLGTPVASLASLITIKIYSRWHASDGEKFFIFFMLSNAIGLLILLTAAKLF